MFRKLFCLILSVFFVICCFSGCNSKSEKEKFTDYSFDYFDTVTTIIGYETDKEEFDLVANKIKSILGEYHSLYNIYNRADVNNLVTVNSSHGTAVDVDKKIIDLLLFSKDIFKTTNGKTNVAMGSVLSIWHTYRQEGLNNPLNAKIPPVDKLFKASEHTDINNVIIDKENSTVMLADAEMSLDVGAIAKGYAVERVAEYLKKIGKDGYLINVGGNVRVVGKKDGKQGWKVGIENPDKNDKNAYITYLEIEDMSVVTSGNYQRFYTVDGVNYHHIIDPDTLMPSDKFSSVSVVCRDSGLADALSTALFVTEFDQGIKLVDNMPEVEAMWVFGDGKVKESKGFKKFVSNTLK